MFEEILARLAAALGRHDIPFMVIGGQAVLLYGEPRLTRDIDVTLGVNTDRLEEFDAGSESPDFLARFQEIIGSESRP